MGVWGEVLEYWREEIGVRIARLPCCVSSGDVLSDKLMWVGGWVGGWECVGVGGWEGTRVLA